MDAILTTADVAARKGILPTSVCRVVRALARSASPIGRKVGRDWIFTPDEADALEKLIRDEAGNPNFGKKSSAKNPKKRREKRGS